MPACFVATSLVTTFASLRFGEVTALVGAMSTPSAAR
jgi:hypothetical protein